MHMIFLRFRPKRAQASQWMAAQTASTAEESIALAKDLKRRGWKFVGPTTVYAFMQAMGLVNEPAVECVVAEVVRQFRFPCAGGCMKRLKPLRL